MSRGEAVLAWYRDHRRDLPWRGETDPYRVLVSEVMLQQTQVARVVDRYPAFLGLFGDAATLAAAPLRDVLAAWSGLGYNSRAVRLRQAARWVTERGWPTTVEGLRQLPGVGPYTAAAVACFAFGEQLPAVDANLRRVLSRWRGEPLRGGALEAAAGEELQGDATDWNQAMMDLGATVCTARRPLCHACPVAAACPGPEGHRPGPAQAGFAGSSRQARGAVVRALLDGALAEADLGRVTGVAPDRLRAAVAALSEEGVVHVDASGTVSLAG